jgi:aspartyl-tRNA(Asn)/glutamyl-tRNA(Gln) amidotransferase subunit C
LPAAWSITNTCLPAAFRFAFAARLLALSPAMAQDAFDIDYVAELARLELTPDEKSRLGAQLGDILRYVDQLKAVEVSGVEPTAHSVPLVNVTRPDVVCASLPHAEALRNAPRQASGLFIVPKIVE